MRLIKYEDEYGPMFFWAEDALENHTYLSYAFTSEDLANEWKLRITKSILSDYGYTLPTEFPEEVINESTESVQVLHGGEASSDNGKV